MPRRKKNHNRKKNPIAILVIAAAIVVLFLIRLVQVLQPLIRQQVFRLGFTSPLLVGWKLTLFGRELLSSLFYFLLSAASIIVLIGFLRLRRWSWVLLMAWTGLSLVISLVNYFYSQPNYVVMASNMIIAFALNITDVKRIFGIRSDENVLGI